MTITTSRGEALMVCIMEDEDGQVVVILDANQYDDSNTLNGDDRYD